MNKHMQLILQENSISLDLNLRVHLDIYDLVRAAHKEFSATANYPKGKGLKFKG